LAWDGSAPAWAANAANSRMSVEACAARLLVELASESSSASWPYHRQAYAALARALPTVFGNGDGGTPPSFEINGALVGDEMAAGAVVAGVDLGLDPAAPVGVPPAPQPATVRTMSNPPTRVPRFTLPCLPTPSTTNRGGRSRRYRSRVGDARDSGLPGALAGLGITQLAFLVPDLAAAVNTWSTVLGRSDWLVYTYNSSTVPVLTFRGEPARFSVRLALSGATPQLELIEPLAGPSIYEEWIDRHGYGAHHVGFHVPRAQPVVDRLAAEGFAPVQAGSGYGLDGDGAFAYYDLVGALGLYAEVIEAPARRRPSEPL
jgi:methylmalonyl-CoA/ethylmalonyl-CoA epimerase